MMKPNPDYVPNPQAADGTITLPAQHGRRPRRRNCATSRCRTRTRSASGRGPTTGRAGSSPSTKPGTFTRRGAARLRQGPGRQRGRGDRRRPDADVHRRGHRRLPELQGRAKSARVKLDKPGRYTLTVQAEDEGGGRGDGPAASGVETNSVTCFIAVRSGRSATEEFVMDLLIALLVLTQPPAAPRAEPPDSWPQWRGPLGTGVAPSANPPVEWSETRNIRWKTAAARQGPFHADRLGRPHFRDHRDSLRRADPPSLRPPRRPR